MADASTSASFVVLPLRRGGVAGLTPAQVRAVAQPDERIVSLSVFDAAPFVRPCAQAQQSLARFIGLDDFAVVLVPRSSMQGMHATAPSTSAGVVGDHEAGRATVTPASWHDMTRTLQPTIAVALHDAVALSEAATSRRRRNTQTRNEAWAKATRALPQAACTVLWPASSLLSLRNSGDGDGKDDDNDKSRRSSDDAVAGCYVDMLPCNENSYEYACNLRAAVALCAGPTMCQATSLVAVLAALHAGVRYIESPLPWALAEKGIALTVSLHTKGNVHSLCSEDDGDDVLTDLNDTRYTLDTRPLCGDCACYTCRRHHRAYVHHLLTVYEMNSTILLALHNLARLLALVRRHRELTSTAAREAYIAAVLAQC